MYLNLLIHVGYSNYRSIDEAKINSAVLRIVSKHIMGAQHHIQITGFYLLCVAFIDFTELNFLLACYILYLDEKKLTCQLLIQIVDICLSSQINESTYCNS